MELLPNKLKEFHTKEYWDQFFRQRKKVAFEWYGDYQSLREPLSKFLLPSHKILNVGCGNSDLSFQMFSGGYQNIINIDFSDIVITEMNKKNKTSMEFRLMDMCAMGFQNEDFDVVLDKGALDALFSEPTPELEADGRRMFEEIMRVLKPKGYYLCVTLAQQFVLSFLLTHFTSDPENNWHISVHQLSPTDANSLHTPFLVALRKSASSRGLEAHLTGQGAASERQTASQVVSLVEQAQAQRSLARALRRHDPGGQHVVVQLFSEDPTEVTARFTISVRDRKTTPASATASNGRCAAFLVPQGREHEWLFASDEGQAQLVDSAAFQRLMIVSFSRGHRFGSMDDVQKELSPHITKLAQKDPPLTQPIPFLTAAQGIGLRTLVARAESRYSGAIVVEDVLEETDWFRRLVFLSNPNLVQSEARLIVPQKPRSAPKPKATRGPLKQNNNNNNNLIDHDECRVDFSDVRFRYQSVMTAGVLLYRQFIGASADDKTRVRIIGLGSGALAMFLHKSFSWAQVEVVELDEMVLELAQKHFGFRSDLVPTHVADGLVHLRSLQAPSSQVPRRVNQVVIFDVDSKEVSKGLGCPPQEFLAEEFLLHVLRLLGGDGGRKAETVSSEKKEEVREDDNHDDDANEEEKEDDKEKREGGMLIVNLVCRAEGLRTEALERLRKIFARVETQKVSDEEVNVVVFAWATRISREFSAAELRRFIAAEETSAEKNLGRKVTPALATCVPEVIGALATSNSAKPPLSSTSSQKKKKEEEQTKEVEF